MARPAIYNLPALVRGDTWRGMGTFAIQINETDPPNELAHVRIQFRKTTGVGLGPELTDENGEIVIDDAEAWQISIPGGKVYPEFTEGTWAYDIETEDSAGIIKTYVAGEIEVIPDVTRVEAE